MKKRYLVLSCLAIITLVAVLFSACRKINDYTELGGDIIPAVDNIHTFDTSLTNIQVYNDTFRFSTDSQVLTRNDVHFIGLINSDPIFGRTDARTFLELKPGAYGVYPFARKDSIKLDSIVLVLAYEESWGDTNMAQAIKVYEINPTPGNQFKTDSNYLVRQENFAYNTGSPLSLPGQFFFPRSLKDSVKVFKDTTAGQLRIRLDTNFARRLLNYDTSNAYRDDSAFRSYFRGFALRSEGGGNALMGFTLTGVNTKLAFYYHYPKVGGGGNDTTVTYFSFNTNCGSANYVKRDLSGTPLAAAAGLPTPASIAYILKSPGSFATVKIPDLPNLSNRVVHRAELIVEQLYDPSDALFPPAMNLYLDAFDPGITGSYKFRTIPYSMDFSPTTGYDLKNFGVAAINDIDQFGNQIKVWKFNLSRYVQHIVNRTQTSYDLRLFAPLTLRGTSRYANTTTDFTLAPNTSYVNGVFAMGRVRVAAQRMRLRIIYSKL